MNVTLDTGYMHPIMVIWPCFFYNLFSRPLFLLFISKIELGFEMCPTWLNLNKKGLKCALTLL